MAWIGYVGFNWRKTDERSARIAQQTELTVKSVTPLARRAKGAPILPAAHPWLWFFSKYGVFSAVCARAGDGRAGQFIDRGRIMVRARRREHLKDLQRAFPDLLGHYEIVETIHADYAYRFCAEAKMVVVQEAIMTNSNRKWLATKGLPETPI